MKSKLIACALILASVAPFISYASGLAGNRESTNDPEIVRTKPIVSPTNATARKNGIAGAQAQTQQPSGLGPNLVPNPSFEQADSSTSPSSWKRGGYGTNNRVLTYPAVPAHSGSAAASIQITTYTNGDAKWYFTPVAVDAGATYQVSDWYTASVPTEVDAQVTHADNSVTYIVLGKPAAAGSYTQFTASFSAPADAKSVTIFHVLNKAGSLTVDDYALQEKTQGDNYVANGDFETVGGNGQPNGWIKGGYGSNTRTFTYPAAGQSGNGASITVSNYVNGDAKWTLATPVTLPQGTYQYSDSYTASVPTILTMEFTRADGSLFYKDMGTEPASASWATANVTFTMPADAVAARMFHLINQNGTLTIDNVSITSGAGGGNGIFDTGAVSFRFDDGLKDQYTIAAPILANAGLLGTFYIISHEIYDNGYTGYMSIAQIQNLYAKGDEIGAHTRTHPHLTQLTADQQKTEIVGSRQDIQAWNVGPVTSFAYPYGEYDATTTQIVENAGFTSAAATISGYVTPASDHYQLQYEEVKSDTTLTQVEQWVDGAKSSHQWLILTFHDVGDNLGDEYAITQDTFESIVNYVKQTGIPVVTVSQGMQSM